MALPGDLSSSASQQKGVQPSPALPDTAAEAPLEMERSFAGGTAVYDRRSSKSMDDVVIVGACRTACAKAKKGAFKDTPADELIFAVVKDTMRRTGVQPDEVEDVCLGTVFPPSSKRVNEARMAMIVAGFPPSVPVYTVNRQCAAGLQAIANVAAGIKAGFHKIGIAGGVESMTTNPLDWEGSENPKMKEHEVAQDVLLPLGITSENVAETYGVPRELQDVFAAASHAKALAARELGKFREEIVPIETIWKDPVSGEEKKMVVEDDDGIRPGTTPEGLAKMKPCFKKDGTVTAGNSCQNTDAAAAVLMMTRREAKRRGLPILGTFRGFATVGVPPKFMGIAPSLAIPKAVDRAGLTLDDIDIFEVNEAFASQAAYTCRKLGLPAEKVNPNGGAIALGHPAGATGARLTVSLLHELKRRGKEAKYGVVGMCTGSGMGAAAVFEKEDGEEQ
ncbi:hypothetical protein N2152v2_003398 [Parachlorella kessleri]